MIVGLSKIKSHYHIMSFKDLKRDYIVDCAKKLFLSRSISEITIKDISATSGIGEATIYRYFQTKENLASSVSVSLQKDILKLPHSDFSKSGLEQIEDFYSLFEKIFKEHPNYYRFIFEFDTLYLKNIKDTDYSLSLDVFHDLFIKSYEVGLKDGSIKNQKNIDLFYYSSTHALLELCKKLASVESPLKQDQKISKSSEINYLISLFISVLKA